jgi:hypothetical protein
MPATDLGAPIQRRRPGRLVSRNSRPHPGLAHSRSLRAFAVVSRLMASRAIALSALDAGSGPDAARVMARLAGYSRARLGVVTEPFPVNVREEVADILAFGGWHRHLRVIADRVVKLPAHCHDKTAGVQEAVVRATSDRMNTGPVDLPQLALGHAVKAGQLGGCRGRQTSRGPVKYLRLHQVAAQIDPFGAAPMITGTGDMQGHAGIGGSSREPAKILVTFRDRSRQAPDSTDGAHDCG